MPEESTQRIPFEEKHLAGCCGLYCGLCPRFQSKAPSRCPSCHLGEHHNYCSVYRCCVIKRGLHTCAECEDFPCERLLRVLGVEEGVDSFISYKPTLPNLELIREAGLQNFLGKARQRRILAEHLIETYNEGRSMTFFCTSCALIPTHLIQEAIDEMDANEQLSELDQKARAKAMKSVLKALASQQGIELKLRRSKK
jgi:hypothetical protein